MGCDIHVYIEHRYLGKDDNHSWSGFGGRINPGRDYHMFAVMAGVRSYDKRALFPVRGLPKGLSYEARNDNQYYVVVEKTGGEREVTREESERWVANGHSKYTDERKCFVTDPDWHNHSWLTPAELEVCIKSVDDVDNKYKAVLATLRSFEDNGEEARIVFWFDN